MLEVRFGLRIALALGILCVPLAAVAQPPAGTIHRIGYLGNAPPASGDTGADAFLTGLRERGWVEGQNLFIERRYSEGRNERFPGLAAELVQLNVNLIVATGTPAAEAARAATTTIPIVFGFVGDPVGSGLVLSLARPGKNATGYGGLFPGLHVKMVELLKETVPKASRIAIAWNAAFSLHIAYLKEVESAAQRLGLESERFDVRSPDHLEGAFAAMVRKRADGVLVLGQPLIATHRALVAKLAASRRLPAIYVFDSVVRAGGLMSYGNRTVDGMRRLPYFIDRILRGARPGDLPVEQPDRFYLVINMKAANALGLTLSPSLLIQAEEVIE